MLSVEQHDNNSIESAEKELREKLVKNGFSVAYCKRDNYSC